MSLHVLLVLGHGVCLVLLDLGMSPVKSDWLQELLHLVVLLSVHSVVDLLDEEVVCLLFMLLLEGLEVLLGLLQVWFSDQVERSGHLLRDLGSLVDLTHCLPHLVLVWVLDSDYLVGRGYCSLTNLVRVFDIILQRYVSWWNALHQLIIVLTGGLLHVYFNFLND